MNWSFRCSRLLLLASCLWLAACAQVASSQAGPGHRIGSLRLLGEQRIALNQPFRDTVIGGLSGIDYDAATDTWVAQSDDRSEINPARFYVMRLQYDLAGFHRLAVEDVKFFRQPDGSLYPGEAEQGKRAGDIPDLESIRIDPRDGSIWYASEGSRRYGMSPFVRRADRNGHFLAHFPVGHMFDVHPDQPLGSRNNLSFEGLSFSADGRDLWLGMEGPLYQDGAPPSLKQGAPVRISRYGRDGVMLAQYAYQLDPIRFAPGGRYADNGLSEILAVDDQRLLALERSGVQGSDGVFRFHIRLYELDVAQATDIRNVAALTAATGITPAAKRLVLDFDTLGIDKVDNLEGVAWGPKLANGHDSLVLISDNNFLPSQVTQVLVFEVLPP
ncbi:esterase-like activity of phytase family protein [Herbaspirillum sp. alder98]|uniref:esterase-like activity of phytase family protein n=1 Tax=Herbaspirillum sp. alder98 TaxID=2913096 RepID=UPI001CD8A130|nr:esterase-like activity of phytase family protein [Herbaspirillum sp. alder98]MCA1325594.1 esterase-like activity of phytase family protein [Herbaspirillum sp. alder98]